MFKQNVGKVDRIIRSVIGAGLIGIGLYMGSYVMAGVGAVIFLTGLLGWCGLYKLLGIDTCPRA